MQAQSYPDKAGCEGNQIECDDCYELPIHSLMRCASTAYRAHAMQIEIAIIA